MQISNNNDLTRRFRQLWIAEPINQRLTQFILQTQMLLSITKIRVINAPAFNNKSTLMLIFTIFKMRFII